MRAVVTDHALLRWLERCRGLDVEALRAILADQVQPLVDLRCKHAPFEGAWAVFDGARLLTIVPNRPDLNSIRKHDAVRANLVAPPEPLHWKGRSRRRAHK